MESPKVELISEKRIFDNYFKVDEATFKEIDSDGNEVTYTRLKLDRPDAVSVMVYNSDEDTVILVKQDRYAVEKKAGGKIFEIPAGKMDEGEDPKETARREVLEEIGYDIKEESLMFLNRFFASPGYSSETVFLFAASVTNADRVTDGGGLESEHENIDIYNVPVTEFFDMVANGGIIDAKSLMGAQALWHLRNQHVVDAGKKYIEIQRLERAKITAEKVINEESDDDSKPEGNTDAEETTK